MMNRWRIEIETKRFLLGRDAYNRDEILKIFLSKIIKLSLDTATLYNNSL